MQPRIPWYWWLAVGLGVAVPIGLLVWAGASDDGDSPPLPTDPRATRRAVRRAQSATIRRRYGEPRYPRYRDPELRREVERERKRQRAEDRAFIDAWVEED